MFQARYPRSCGAKAWPTGQDPLRGLPRAQGQAGDPQGHHQGRHQAKAGRGGGPRQDRNRLQVSDVCFKLAGRNWFQPDKNLQNLLVSVPIFSVRLPC